MGSTASDNAKAIEAVQRATALVRAAAGKLRDPLPAKDKNLAGDFLGSLLSPLQGQMPLLELNPLNAEAMSELAAKAAQYVQKARVEESVRARSASQIEFAKTLAEAVKKKQLTPDVMVKAAERLYAAPKSTDATGTRKLTLVKPVQDIHAQLAALFEQTTQPMLSSQQKQSNGIQDTFARNIKGGIAPRATAGRSGEATLGKLLQQLELLANDALLDLAGVESIGDVAARMAGEQRKSGASERKAKTPQSLAQLADIVGDLWQQTFSSDKASSQTARKTAPAKSNQHAGEPSRRPVSPVVDEARPNDRGGISPTATNPSATVTSPAPGNTAAAPAIDAYALANGINEVLREQAWLAGVDLT
jgi:hypothetical protein